MLVKHTTNAVKTIIGRSVTLTLLTLGGVDVEVVDAIVSGGT
jgi:hypothetical protein